jgi:hypothetical protein
MTILSWIVLVFRFSYLPLILLISWPFIVFLATNLNETEYTARIIAVWIAVLAICIFLLITICYIFKKIPTARLSIFIGVLVAWFFSYLPLSELLVGWGFELGRPRLLVWLGIAVLLGLGSLLARPLRDFTVVANVIALILIIPPLGTIVSHHLSTTSIQAAETSLRSVKANDVKRKPNVYWIMLDGYSRADLLKYLVDFDNSDFVNKLRSHDFWVGEQNTSNYTSTKTSISTTLNMDYYIPVGETLRSELWTLKLTGFNNVVSRFKALGYQYYHVEFGSVNLSTRCGGSEDLCITGKQSDDAILSESEIGLLKLTPLFPVMRRLGFGLLGISLIDPKDIFDKLRQLRPFRTKPFFLYGHILSPHTPNRYSESCTRRPTVDWNVADRYLNPEVVSGYVRDVQCLNHEVIEGVTEILKNDKSNPIIIIQSDHGSPLLVQDPDSFYLAGFANLSAMHFPPGCRQKIHDTISSVNTFRLVFSCIEGRDIPLLPDRHFWAYESKVGLTEVKLAPLPRK